MSWWACLSWIHVPYGPVRYGPKVLTECQSGTFFNFSCMDIFIFRSSFTFSIISRRFRSLDRVPKTIINIYISDRLLNIVARTAVRDGPVVVGLRLRPIWIKTYENDGNKGHQTSANDTQCTTIIHLEIDCNMLSRIPDKIVIFNFYRIRI